MKRTAYKKPSHEAQILRFMRQSKKLSFREAGRLIGVSGSLINHYEHGRMDLTESRCHELCAAYGYSEVEFAEYRSGRAIPIVSIKDECSSAPRPNRLGQATSGSCRFSRICELR